MSTRVQARRPTSRRRTAEGGGSSGRRKMVRDLDLNRHPDGASASSADALLLLNAEPPLPQPVVAQPPQQPQPPPPPPNDGDQAIVITDEDDDVVLLSSSTTRFPQARGPPIVPVILLDEDFDVQQGHWGSGLHQAFQHPNNWLSLHSDSRPERNQRKRTFIDCDEYETRNYFPRAKVVETMQLKVLEAPPPPPPPPPPKEPVFNCSVCLGELDEATSTICGHIFCHKCIKASIQAQKKCPTCRKNLTMKNVHRVYLPTTK